MMLGIDQSRPLTGLLTEHADQISKRWTEKVGATLQARLSSAELHRQVQDLQTLVNTGSPYAIIDITGVRPQTVQTIVALGIEFSDIATKASLTDALRHVQRVTDLRPAAASS